MIGTPSESAQSDGPQTYAPDHWDLNFRDLRGTEWFDGATWRRASTGLDLVPFAGGYVAFAQGGSELFVVDEAVTFFPLDARGSVGPKRYLI